MGNIKIGNKTKFSFSCTQFLVITIKRKEKVGGAVREGKAPPSASARSFGAAFGPTLFVSTCAPNELTSLAGVSPSK